MTVSWKVPQMMFSTLDAHLLPAPPSLVHGPMTWMQVASLFGHILPLWFNNIKLFHTPAWTRYTKVQFQLTSSLYTSVTYTRLWYPSHPSIPFPIGIHTQSEDTCYLLCNKVNLHEWCDRIYVYMHLCICIVIYCNTLKYKLWIELFLCHLTK